MRIGSSTGCLIRRPLWPSVAETAVIGFRTSKVVSSSPCNRPPLAARSTISAISGLVCEGKWSQSERGGGVRVTEFDVASSGVAYGVQTLNLIPVAVAVT